MEPDVTEKIVSSYGHFLGLFESQINLLILASSTNQVLVSMLKLTYRKVIFRI